MAEEQPQVKIQTFVTSPEDQIEEIEIVEEIDEDFVDADTLRTRVCYVAQVLVFLLALLGKVLKVTFVIIGHRYNVLK